MKLHSLRFKFTAISVAVILATILSVIGVSYSSVQKESERRSVENMRLVGEETANELDGYFGSIEQAVNMAANLAMDSLDSVKLVEYGAAGHKAGQHTAEQSALLDDYLTEHCEIIRQHFGSMASHTNGVITYYYCINPQISTAEHSFFYSRVGKAGFVEQEPLDARTLDPADTEHTVWYYTPIERGRPSWIGPYTAHFLNEMSVCSYVVPIYGSGALIGVLGMGVSMDTMIEQVEQIRLYRTGFASLCDEDGRIIWHPSMEPGTVPELSDVSVERELLHREDSGNTLIRYVSGGEKRQMSFSTLRNGMKLVLTAPVKEINSNWLRLIRMVLYVTAVAVVVYVFVLMHFAGLLTRPLRRLTAASQKLADGDYDVELGPGSRDEVGELTEAFGRMRDRIRQYIDDLNHRIYTDALTDLPNMRSFFTSCLTERQKLLDAELTPAMLYFDLVGMKFYNRQFGFEEGDKLLCEIGAVLLRHFGDRSVCRLSDDHFAAISTEEGLEEKLEAVFRDCEKANGGRSLPIHAGVYLCRLGEVGPSVACDRAKFACSRHRDSYMSAYYVFDLEMVKELENVRYIITHLDRALEERWIQVWYQPIIRAVNGRVCEEEALSRWIDPEKGLLSPGVFIPILERHHLIYKLDLYVLDRILEKIQAQKAAGLRVVPHSLNLSRSDFDSCDIVEEIRRRVDESGVARDRITIEVTESMVGSDFAFMKEQILRFQALGFRVWMDDFGSGYSALDVLQEIHFDLLKFDMRFMQRFEEGEESKIILTELVRMAIGLGIDTVCEGVETAEQVEFLREIGCTMLQGFYYCKAIPFEEIVERNKKGIQIGFENPAESAYFSSIGRVNLYDLTVIAAKEDAGKDYFDMLPVGILELKDDEVFNVRSNQSYREFMKQHFGFDLQRRGEGYPASPWGAASAFMKTVRKCCAEGNRAFFDGKLDDGSPVHVVINPVGTNQVTGATAVAIAVLSVSDPDESTTYAEIARALAADYYNIYVIDLDTDRFIEYSSTVGGEELAVERHGERFFAAVKRDAVTRIFEADRGPFLAAFSKENIVRELGVQGVFSATYRLIDTGTPMYANMKITRMLGGNRIIMGISIIDDQMKQAEEAEHDRQERTAYARIAALSGNFIALYAVDPLSGRFTEYSATEDYKEYGLDKTGEDFFSKMMSESPKHVDPADLPMFLQHATRENMMREIRRNGLFALNYRLIINGKSRPISLRAALVEEHDGEKLIVGINRLNEAD